MVTSFFSLTQISHPEASLTFSQSLSQLSYLLQSFTCELSGFVAGDIKYQNITSEFRESANMTA